MNATGLLEAYLTRHQLPLRLWMAPEAWSLWREPLFSALGQAAALHEVRGTAEHDRAAGPAILVLTAKDLSGVHREALLAAARRALPGRPVVIGGNAERDVLLDAINTWHAFRVLPARTPSALVIDAVRKALAAASLEAAADRCAAELQDRCVRLRADVAELHRTREQVVHAERIGTVGRTTRTLCSHLGEHYRFIEAFEDELADVRAEPLLAGLLECAREGLRSLGTLLQDMVALSEGREDELVLGDEDLDLLVGLAVRMVRLESSVRRRRLGTSLVSGVRVRVDRYRLFHVLANLVRNAVQATPHGGAIEVRTMRDGDRAVIEVEDDGCGMSPEVQEHIFTPFFSTKGADGMGLGLRVSRTIVERQHGTLECSSVPGEGSCFRVTFPVLAEPAST